METLITLTCITAYLFSVGFMHQKLYQSHRETCYRCEDRPRLGSRCCDFALMVLFIGALAWPFLLPLRAGHIFGSREPGNQLGQTRKQAREIRQAHHMAELAKIHLQQAKDLEAAAELNPLSIRKAVA